MILSGEEDCTFAIEWVNNLSFKTSDLHKENQDSIANNRKWNLSNHFFHCPCWQLCLCQVSGVGSSGGLSDISNSSDGSDDSDRSNKTNGSNRSIRVMAVPAGWQ